jgi:hypothetical protein
MIHGRRDQGISQKLNLLKKAQYFHQQFQSHLKMNNVGRNIYCEYTSDAEEILKFKTSKGFKKQVAYGTVGRNK